MSKSKMERGRKRRSELEHTLQQITWLDQRSREILTQWWSKEEEDIGCCIAIALWWRNHYLPAWEQALAELEKHERSDPDFVYRNHAQMQLF